jgi:4-aminobutyrate aminotransferase-like enzyme
MDLKQVKHESLPIVKTELPGPRSRAIRERELKHISPGLSAVSLLSGLAMKDGLGALVRDVDDNVFIDLSSGAVVTVTGHSHPRVVEEIQNSIGRFIHIYDYGSDVRAEFLELLAEVTPESIDCFQMFTAGAETIEGGMRLAKAATKNHEFISLYRGFHGKTVGALSAMGGNYKKGFAPLVSGMYQTPNAYCYRCPLGLTYPSCNAACADFIENVYQEQSTGAVAAVVMEAIQGAGGVIIPPPEFVKKISEFCKKNGILLFIDEILTSAGRTGKLWASQHYDAQPDIMTMGKGIASGFPLGIVGSRKELMENWPWDQFNGGTSTFGGSPVSAAAALATLKVIEEEQLVEKGAEVGAHIKSRLTEMKNKYQVLGDVRGVGMLMAVELVKDRDTKERISQQDAENLYRMILKRGVMVASAAPIMRITPPLVLSKQLADRALDLIDEAFAEFEKSRG